MSLQLEIVVEDDSVQAVILQEMPHRGEVVLLALGPVETGLGCDTPPVPFDYGRFWVLGQRGATLKVDAANDLDAPLMAFVDELREEVPGIAS